MQEIRIQGRKKQIIASPAPAGVKSVAFCLSPPFSMMPMVAHPDCHVKWYRE
jgi:hypothetical protein